MEYIERPEVDGTPVMPGDVLFNQVGDSYVVRLVCEGWQALFTDGGVRPVEGMRRPADSTEEILARLRDGSAPLSEVVDELYDLIVREWAAGVAYRTDDKVTYDDVVYRCVQAHTSQADWTPDATPALWARGYKPDDVPEWVQPTGAHDAYGYGARVRHNRKVWKSTVDNNVWEPGVYGWSEA